MSHYHNKKITLIIAVNSYNRGFLCPYAKGVNIMKLRQDIRRILAVTMTIVMIVTLFPISAFAYVGAMQRDGN